jgi:hypothetical protein
MSDLQSALFRDRSHASRLIGALQCGKRDRSLGRTRMVLDALRQRGEETLSQALPETVRETLYAEAA